MPRQPESLPFCMTHVAKATGLKSAHVGVSTSFGTQGFWRLRIGIGHPGDREAVVDYVLSSPTPDERALIEAAVARGLEVMPLVLAGDMQGAMQTLHRAEKGEKGEGQNPKPPSESKE